MRDYTLIVGLDEPEANAIADGLDGWSIAHVVLPKIIVRDGELWAETGQGVRMARISKVIFHGIYEDDLDFLTGLAIWGGNCLPNPRGMMDCRLKLPCLVRALSYTRFGEPLRGFASANAYYDASGIERVAKWGNWHCGENKVRFGDNWQGENASIVEHFITGQAVRVAIIGDHAWQIKLDGDDWLKSIHHSDAQFMPIDDELLEDTRNIQAGFGLEIIANDYMIADDGTKHLLEVNHIPNVTRFPEIWEAYRDYAIAWANSK